MTLEDFLQEEFGHTFTPSQARAAFVLTRFAATRVEDACVVLRGYAGTGKTSLVAALVRLLRACGRQVVLLAPTGRAAKVLGRYAGAPAFTIHRFIYRQKTFAGEDTSFSRGFNSLKDAVFIVDEASMLPSRADDALSLFADGRVLDDLVHFVYNGRGCRMLLVGDAAQLPPVGEERSAALCDDVLAAYGLRTASVDLTDVVRQQEASGILCLATALRRMLTEEAEIPSPELLLPNALAALPPGAKDVRGVWGDAFVEALETAYRRDGMDETVVVVRTNRQAVAYNNAIRARVLDRDALLTRGDRLLVAKNNYFWLTPQEETSAPAAEKRGQAPTAFIANGDVCEVVALRGEHEQHGFLFADATLRFPDYGDREVDCRLLLSTLQSESGALSRDESRRLFDAVAADYAHIPLKADRMRAIRRDPYYNALQVKYAYALTCHKAQGGQWQNVFLDAGFLPPDASAASHLRWLYTAATRATERLYLVGLRTSDDDF